MNNRSIPAHSYSPHGSQEELLPRQKRYEIDETVFYSQRTLKPSTEERYIRKAASLLDVRGTDDSPLCQRSLSKWSVNKPLLSSESRQEEIESPHFALPKTSEELKVHTTQPSVTKKTTEEEKPFHIGAEKVLAKLKSIMEGESIRDRLLNACLGCFYKLSDITSDRKWLKYLSERIKQVDKFSEQCWNYHPQVIRTVIQHILFSYFLAVQRYEPSIQSLNSEPLTSMENEIKSILKHYYWKFGAEQFRKIFDSKTYPNKSKTVWQFGRQQLPDFDFNVVSRTLEVHFSQRNHKYLPNIVRQILNTTSDTVLEDILGFNQEEQQKMADRSEQNRLLQLFTHRSLSPHFTPVQTMKGLQNYGNTCFAAASTWLILCSTYLSLLSEIAPDSTEHGPLSSITEQDMGEDYISLTSWEDAIGLNSLSPELCLSLLRHENNRDKQIRLLQTGLTKCLATMASQYHEKQYPDMQATYKQLLDLCIQGAIQDNFSGFENFTEFYIKRMETHFEKMEADNKKNKKSERASDSDTKNESSIFQPKHLPQQDSPEFLAPLLKLVIPKANLNKCAFRVLTERLVMRNSEILTIADDPLLIPKEGLDTAQMQDTQQPDTFIYSVPVSSEQTESDDFSIQMILDDALSFQNIADAHQKITVKPDDFRHAIQKFPSSLSRTIQTGVEDHKWDVIQERQVLLVAEIPKVITIQPKMLLTPCDRARISEKLVHDKTQEFQLTFRKVSTDKSLPPENVTHKYRILAKVFYVEDDKARTRHYRCLIENDRLPENSELETNDRAVIDDSVIFRVPENKDLSTELGILCMFTAEIVPAPKAHFSDIHV